MARLTCQFVRPDKKMYEGECASIVLATLDGELGVLPGHAPEICALGDGIVRLNFEGNQPVKHILISGGYAQITGDSVIILANHARSLDDIEKPSVEQTRHDAVLAMEQYPVGDSRRAYYQNKIDWCDLLLAHKPE